MWDAFVQLLFNVWQFLSGLVGDWGLGLVLFTVIIRLAIMPLMTKSVASNAKMQALQPLIQEMQEKYADDPQRLNEEMRKFQAENDFNPLGGCLPLLIQMPILMAMFSAMRMIDTVDPTPSFLGWLPMDSTASAAFADGGFVQAGPYLLCLLLAGVLTAIPMLLNMTNVPEESRGMSIGMTVMTSGMLMWFGWGMPFAIDLYYVVSAVWQVAQQVLVTNRVMAKVKEEEAQRLENRGVQVDVVRKEKKKRPKKKG